MWLHHPDDEPSPRFGNHWSNDFNTFADACAFYGCDTPEQVAAEMAEHDAELASLRCDEIEAWSTLCPEGYDTRRPRDAYQGTRFDFPGYSDQIDF